MTDLDKLDALHAATTAGEWKVFISKADPNCIPGIDAPDFTVVLWGYSTDGRDECGVYSRDGEDNATFIASVKNAWPAVSAELRALREERDKAAVEERAAVVKWLRGMTQGAKMPARIAAAIEAGEHHDTF